MLGARIRYLAQLKGYAADVKITPEGFIGVVLFDAEGQMARVQTHIRNLGFVGGGGRKTFEAMVEELARKLEEAGGKKDEELIALAIGVDVETERAIPEGACSENSVTGAGEDNDHDGDLV